jgi:hypothetical protein
MKFRFVFWVVPPCKIIVDRRFRGIALMMEAERTSETSIDIYFTRQYNPEDKSELHCFFFLHNHGFLRNASKSNESYVASVVWWCLLLDPRFAGSNPAEVMDF